jgi:hypothetical protein
MLLLGGNVYRFNAVPRHESLVGNNESIHIWAATSDTRRPYLTLELQSQRTWKRIH